jgi:hypothetical protein
MGKVSQLSWQEGTALTQASYRRLLERLSPEGAKKLVAQIAVVKSQMKAIGRPQ